jgi:hypothetical protein
VLVRAGEPNGSATSEDGASTVMREGSRSRSAMRDPARLRLWPSSPICSVWAMIALTSRGPCALTACCRRGPSTRDIQCRRSMTSRPYAPYRSTLPSPSFREQYAVPPCTLSFSSNIHIEGETTPAIGPTVLWWWQGSSVTPSPDARAASASSGVLARLS